MISHIPLRHLRRQACQLCLPPRQQHHGPALCRQPEEQAGQEHVSCMDFRTFETY
jgi:hypothetical protein